MAPMAEAMIPQEYRNGNVIVSISGGETAAEQRTNNGSDDGGRTPPPCLVTSTTAVVPSTKRQKLAPAITVNKILEDISYAISHHRRLASLVTACTSFDHDMTAVHDEEVRAGAPCVLSKHLSFLLMKKQLSADTEHGNSDEGDVWKELGYTCSALEMVYRCSITQLAESYHLIGTELVPLLLTVMAHALQRGDDSAAVNQGPESKDIDDSIVDVAVIKATKILGHFATISTALVPMAQQRGLLSTLRRMAISNVIDKARFSSIWTLANLACDAENMILMACHPGLLDSLVDVAYGDRSFEARTHAMKALMNLAWRPENKIPMSERPRLLSAMVRLIGSSVLKTRRHAARAFRFLSDTPPKNKSRLCDHPALLSAMVKRAGNDVDRSIRECAITTLHNLACEETVEVMGRQTGLLAALTTATLADERGTSPTVAAEALYVLAEHITPEMECYQELQKSLDAVAAHKESSSPSNWSPRQQNILRRLTKMRRVPSSETSPATTTTDMDIAPTEIDIGVEV